MNPATARRARRAASRSPSRLATALVLSLLCHGLLLSLQFGLPGLGLPGFELPWNERRGQATELTVRLANVEPARPAPALPKINAPKNASRAAAAKPRPRRKPLALPPPPLARMEAPPLPDLPLPEFTVQNPQPAPVTEAAAPQAAVAPAPAPPPPQQHSAVIAQAAPHSDTFAMPPPSAGRPDVAPTEEHASPVMPPDHDETSELQTATPQPPSPPPEEQRAERQRAEAAAAEQARQQESIRQQEALARQQALEQEARRRADELALQQRQEAERKAEQERLAQAAADAQKREEENAARLLLEKEIEARRQAEEAARQQAAALALQKERDEALQRDQEAAARRAQELEALRLEEQRRQEAAQARQREIELETQKRQEEAERERAAALARQQEAEALAARQRTKEIERQKAAAEAAAQQRDIDRLLGEPAPSAVPSGSRGTKAGEGGGISSNIGGLAARALEQAKNNELSAAPPSTVMQSNPRRRSLFGSLDNDVGLHAYVENWRQKIERNGSLNYAQSSSERARGDPVVTVAIRSDGSIESIVFNRPSGRPELDAAVRRILNLYAPFGAFPPALARRYDVIEIRRIWSFDDRLRILEEVR